MSKGQIKVIGVGLARTGTLSLKIALEQLGYTKTYHMEELLRSPEHLPFWKAALRRERVDWNDLFQDYQATVDYPGCYFYEDILQRYPGAQVILTTRDADAWYDSVAATIYRLRPKSLVSTLRMAAQAVLDSRFRSLTPVFWYANQLIWNEHFQQRFEDRDFAKRIFKQHGEAVRDIVPADQLLVYEISQGWEPLCKFLDRPLPSIPFPHSNSRADFKCRRQRNWVNTVKNED